MSQLEVTFDRPVEIAVVAALCTAVADLHPGATMSFGDGVKFIFHWTEQPPRRTGPPISPRDP
jgi:hypothetical protein